MISYLHQRLHVLDSHELGRQLEHPLTAGGLGQARHHLLGSLHQLPALLTLQELAGVLLDDRAIGRAREKGINDGLQDPEEVCAAENVGEGREVAIHQREQLGRVLVLQEYKRVSINTKFQILTLKNS